MRRLVVVNQRSVGSLGLDSITGSASSAAPPGYTSQLDTTSSIDLVDESKNGDGEVVLMEPRSKAVLDSLYALPSPSSIEDLSLVVATEHALESRGRSRNSTLSLHRSPTQGCIHGYTHTHSQCTPVSSFNHPTLIDQRDVSHTTNTPLVPSSYYPRAPQKEQHRGNARPESCDDPDFYDHHHILSTDNLCGVNERSHSSGHYRRCSTEERSPSSPYHRHHHQNTYPPPCADIRVLTYPSTDEGIREYDDNHEEYRNGDGNEQDSKEDVNEGRSPLNNKNMMMTMMNSTATIPSPSEEHSGRRQGHDSALPSHRRRHSHTKSTTRFNSNSLSAAESSDHSSPPLPPLPPNSTHPTNYVHLSRKCTPSTPTPSKFWARRKIVQPTQIPPRLSSSTSSSSAITGTFVIDPGLYIPPSLLNAMEDPVFRFKSSSVTETSTLKTSKKGDRRTNLRLEVEGGGIDVDIRLVPSRISTGGTCIRNTRNRGHLDAFCDTPVQAQVGASTSTIAFSGAGSPSSTEGFEKRPPRPSSLLHRSAVSLSPTIRIQENPAQARKEGIHRSAVTRTTSSTSRRVKKKRSGVTTIDLRIKQVHGGLNLENQDSVKPNGPVAFPLIARIHAPNPRPPFHLFASTIDIPNRIIAKTQNASPLREPQDLTTREREDPSGAFRSSHTSNQPFSEPLPVVNSPPPPPPPCRRARRSLSKPHPQRVSSSHRGTFIGTSHPASASPPTAPLNLAPSSSSSSSPLYLHLPRTFRGPLTIHISSGHVGDHLRLSAGLEREVALIRESEFGRGYFVGGLGWDGDIMDGYGGPEEEADEVGHSYKTGRSIHNRDPIYHRHNLRVEIERTPSGRSNEAHAVDDAESSSSSISSTSIISSEEIEWYGDRIEILVGSGDVYLQFEDEDEDEDDPFGSRSSRRREGGFWKLFSRFF